MNALSMPILWLLIFAILIVVELLTMGLTTIWFAMGAVVACILSIFKVPVWAQAIVFIAASGILLYFTRPIAMKHFNKNRFKSNVEAMIGQTGVVISEVDNVQGIGQVKVAGMDWSARSIDDNPIAAGTVVRIKKVEGVKLIVKEEEK